jgi:nicotinamidase-related amidase
MSNPMTVPAELRVDPAGAVLLIVDVQVRLAGAMDPQGLAACERNILTLIELARRLGMPLVVSEQYPRGLGPTVPAIAGALEAAAAGGARLLRLEKTAFACTGEPAFAGLLEQLGGERRQWLVTGMESHVCVWQTVRGLRALGRSVQVIEDAVLSRQAANHRLGLALCDRAGAIVTSTETVAFDALVRAGSEDFKAISRLVK